MSNDQKLRVVRAKLTNVFGFDEFEFELGKFTLLKGANGQGKTTALEAIRSLWASGQDATLLRQGAKDGEIVLILNDGMEVVKKVLADKTFISVKIPKLGKISRPQSVLKGLVDPFALNPVEFLTAKPTRQKELFLGALPLTVTKAELEAAIGHATTLSTDGHALTVIEAFEKLFYEDRTSVNRDLKQKQAAVEQIETSLPPDPPEGDWTSSYCLHDEEMTTLSARWTEQIQAATREAERDVAALDASFRQSESTIRQAVQEQIRAIEARMHTDIKEQAEEYERLKEEIRQGLPPTVERIKAELDPKIQHHMDAREHARTMGELHAKAASGRQLLAQMQQEAKDLEVNARELTRSLEGLRYLKTNLTAQLPIPGAEIRGEELYLDGIPLSRVQESRKVTLAVELAMLRSGELGLILVDGLERLDSQTLDLFKQTIARYDAQVLGTVVEDPDPAAQGLRVESV